MNKYIKTLYRSFLFKLNIRFSFYDKVYNIREMDQVFTDVSEIVNLDIPSNVRNASKSNAKKDELSPKAIAYLEDFYRKDYQTFAKHL